MLNVWCIATDWNLECVFGTANFVSPGIFYAVVAPDLATGCLPRAKLYPIARPSVESSLLLPAVSSSIFRSKKYWFATSSCFWSSLSWCWLLFLSKRLVKNVLIWSVFAFFVASSFLLASGLFSKWNLKSWLFSKFLVLEWTADRKCLPDQRWGFLIV